MKWLNSMFFSFDILFGSFGFQGYAIFSSEFDVFNISLLQDSWNNLEISYSFGVFNSTCC